MLINVQQVINETQINEINEILNKAIWPKIDETSQNKKNGQFPQNSKEIEDCCRKVIAEIEKNPLFISYCLPNKIFPPYFDRFETGQVSGSYVDNAINSIPGTNFKIRTDISAVLFLSKPTDYEGGELVIEDQFGTHSVKPEAGDLILFPSNALRYINEVKSGIRQTAFFWIESLVRNEDDRAILFDLDESIRNISQKQSSNDNIAQLIGIYNNLLRRLAVAS